MGICVQKRKLFFLVIVCGFNFIATNSSAEALTEVQAFRRCYGLITSSSVPPTHYALQQVVSGNWHFQGQIQSNKLKSITSWASVIHSLDDSRHFELIEKLAPHPLSIFLQVSLDGAHNRGGAGVDQLYQLAEKVQDSATHTLLGLMSVPPVGMEPNQAYSELAVIRNEFTKRFPDANSLSAGMSGDYEAAIAHSGILEAGDRAVLFKTAVKEIAYKHGIMATFMAKINENLPGCGGHVHQSLWDKAAKKNLFFDGKDKDNLSDTAKNYIAGQLHCLPYILAMFAPTVNSYKRLVEGAWAPTTLTWGIDNRTTALRILNGSNNACRIETRVIGSDVNPYLAMAACLAAGLYGIRKKMKLKQPATVGNGYRDYSNGILPHTLIDATIQMKTSPIAQELFGKAFVDHFVQSREWEWRQHLKAVTDWEYKRYFEII